MVSAGMEWAMQRRFPAAPNLRPLQTTARTPASDHCPTISCICSASQTPPSATTPAHTMPATIFLETVYCTCISADSSLIFLIQFLKNIKLQDTRIYFIIIGQWLHFGQSQKLFKAFNQYNWLVEHLTQRIEQKYFTLKLSVLQDITELKGIKANWWFVHENKTRGFRLRVPNSDY